MNFPKIAHGDHPMSKAQLSWIQKHPEIAKMKEGAFICKVFKLLLLIPISASVYFFDFIASLGVWTSTITVIFNFKAS